MWDTLGLVVMCIVTPVKDGCMVARMFNSFDALGGTWGCCTVLINVT